MSSQEKYRQIKSSGNFMRTKQKNITAEAAPDKTAIGQGHKNGREDEIHDLRREVTSLKEEIVREQLRTKLATEKYAELEKRSEKLRLEKSEEDRKTIEKDAYISDLQRQIRILTNKVEELKPKRKYKVQMLCKDGNEVMDEVLNAFLQALHKHKSGPEIDLIRCTKASDIQTNNPLVLFCLAGENVVRELTQAIKGLTVCDKTAVVVVHLTDDAIQLTKDTGDIARNKQLCSLSGVFDLTFTRDKGLSAGRINRETVENIIAFIKSKA